MNIEPMQFATIISAKKLKKSGLSLGEEVFVVGSKVLPEKKNDPYLMRYYVIVVKLDEDNIPLIPTETDENYAWLVDPRNLEAFNSEKQADYTAKFELSREPTIN